MQYFVFRSLLNAEELHVERELGVWGDHAGVAAAAVRVVRRADQLGALSNGPGRGIVNND